MSVRKNFVFDEEVAAHLKEMAKENRQSMTSFVEERYGSKKVAEQTIR